MTSPTDTRYSSLESCIGALVESEVMRIPYSTANFGDGDVKGNRMVSVPSAAIDEQEHLHGGRVFLPIE